MEVSLQEKLHNDLKDAMRARDESRVGVIRMALASLHRRAIEKRTAKGIDLLSSEEELEVIRGEEKQRRESRDLFLSGGRKDLADKEEFEIAVLSEFLPPEMPREEIERVIREAIRVSGASSGKDFGTVMKEAMKTLKGKADGSLVGAVIRELLPS